MSEVFFISDLHFGHRSILKYRQREGITTEQEHSELIFHNIMTVVSKRDNLWVLGDVAFTKEWLYKLKYIKCRKNLILGNHDEHNMQDYLNVFDSVHAFVKFREFWLSHCPMHEAELRGRINVHGHVHKQTIMKDGKPDPRYYNVCVENVDWKPISLTELKAQTEEMRKINHEERERLRSARNATNVSVTDLAV